MRTAAICPTCATYENAVCVIYNGDTLYNINVPPLTDLETALGSVDASIGSVIALINAVATNPIFLTTIGTSGPATISGNVLNVPEYQPTFQDVITNGNELTSGLPFYTTGNSNGAVINNTNLTASRNYELPDADGTIALTSDIPGYKVYTAVISQTGTGAPTVDYVLNNTLGFTPTFQYDDTGTYIVNNGVSGWTNNKTVVFLTPGYPSTSYIFSWDRVNASDIYLYTTNSTNNTFTNSCLNKASIEIRVYP